MRLFARILSALFVTILFFGALNAQLCQGSLGDPIINITFGAGPNPGPQLNAATTAYQYVVNDCPNDGYYTVRSNTSTCFGNTWHSLSKDHTGDPNGYFMLVNASVQPSAFYLDYVNGLCGGTTYEFAAWIINVLRPGSCAPSPTQPNLTFTIEKTDGTILQSYNTNTIGSETVPTWEQFGFFFTTPTNVTDVVVRIFNNAPGGCGNDLALDDITFRPCGPQLSVGIANSPTDTVTYCEGIPQSFTFNANISAGFNNPLLQWQQSNDGVTWSDIADATTTTLTRDFTSTAPPAKYLYRISAAEAGNLNTPQCRIASKPLMIEISANPVPAAGSNSPVCANSTLNLSASDGEEYTWTGPNNFSASGATIALSNAQTNQSGKYRVLVTNAAGCITADSVNVAINPNPVAVVSFPVATICEKDNTQLQSSGGTGYKWSPAAGLSSDVIANPVASPVVTTQYTVVVSNQFTCADTAGVLVNVIEAPRAFAGVDKWIIEGNNAQITANATGQDISYSWTPTSYISDPLSLQPVVNPPQDANYVLNVVSNAGCGTAKDTMKVFVFKDVFVPSAFTPNNDGLNDTWNIPALNAFPGFILSVYNRYGQLVYQNKDINIPWDGKLKGQAQASGVYVYYLDLKVPGGKRKGTVTIIR